MGRISQKSWQKSCFKVQFFLAHIIIYFPLALTTKKCKKHVSVLELLFLIPFIHHINPWESKNWVSNLGFLLWRGGFRRSYLRKMNQSVPWLGSLHPLLLIIFCMRIGSWVLKVQIQCFHATFLCSFQLPASSSFCFNTYKRVFFL